MSYYSELVKKSKENDMKCFFGDNVHMLTNKYFTFDRVIDNDTIIIVTSNVIRIKNNFCLIVGNNKALYLKDWQIRILHNYYEEISKIYAVKLNRSFFKPYTFQKRFDNFIFEEDQNFDTLVGVAKRQQKENMKFALGQSN